MLLLLLGCVIFGILFFIFISYATNEPIFPKLERYINKNKTIKENMEKQYKETLSRSLSLVIQDIEDQLHYYDDIRQNGTEKEELEAYRHLKNYIHTKERIVQNELSKNE